VPLGLGHARRRDRDAERIDAGRSGLRREELARARRVHLDLEVDPVEQRARDPRAVAPP
jgi:hypothetical protein